MIGGNQLERAISFSDFIKSLDPSIPIVFGGPMATIVPYVLLDVSSIDYVIRGQGEKPMLELTNALVNKVSCQDINGVMGKSSNETNPVLFDKNSFPKYSWHLLNVENYIRNDQHLGKRVLNYSSSQGCPQKCGYCSEVSSYSCRWTAYSARRTFEEVIELAEVYNLDGIKFYDSNFFVNPKRVIEFGDLLIQSEKKIKWGASAHPKNIIRLRNHILKIKESGLSRLLIGAESGSQKALDHIRKDCTIDDILQTSEICAKYAIPTVFTFIVGIPSVNDNDIKKTMDMVIKIKKIWSEFEIKIHFYAPFPGTPLFDEAVKYGYNAPSTLKEWSKHDYYLVQTPWIDKRNEENVRRFSDFYCDFYYPPKWFKEMIEKKPFMYSFYKILRQLTKVRCRLHFYRLPFEMYLFKKVTK